MKFCTNCQNMYYISLTEENSNTLVYYCRNCGHNDTTEVDTVCVCKTKIEAN